MPADSTLLVRPRSSLGLKYIELSPGAGQRGSRRRAPRSRCARRARPSVELDDFFNMFDDKTRVGPAQLAGRLRRRPRGARPGHQHGDRGVRAAR